MKFSTKQLVTSAMVAAIYVVVTLFIVPALSFQSIQFRIAEAFTALPYFSPIFIPSLFIGCIISNLGSPLGVIDIALGSLATLISACLTYLIGKSSIKYKKFLAPLPPVIINALVVGFELNYILKLPLLLTMLQVGIGEFVCAYILGLVLISFIEKNSKFKKLFSGEK
ncbi:QueT transporter family protein [Clostridium oryzae]|uniref:Queuosine transporter QueT n=1 Tax=Clostridium oryzae TaxID=1450648 RepID=A0A1V4IF67_9CLOT|nr:QueT transporter family protein [Clostridium oryzae]OPJ58494.1 queuosine precursor transporter QueT [Clostridium oryzae]